MDYRTKADREQATADRLNAERRILFERRVTAITDLITAAENAALYHEENAAMMVDGFTSVRDTEEVEEELQHKADAEAAVRFLHAHLADLQERFPCSL